MLKPKILIIEDEVDIRNVLSEVLELQGYTVLMSPDGIDGWQKVSKNIYNMIITDLGIPGLNGLELVKKMRESNIQTPVLIITGVIFSNPSSEIATLQPCDVLIKPFKIEDLLKILRQNIYLKEMTGVKVL